MRILSSAKFNFISLLLTTTNMRNDELERINQHEKNAVRIAKKRDYSKLARDLAIVTFLGRGT